MVLSRKAKEAIKTGLAMTITYGIALWMDWDKPSWAGFAVVATSLTTIGQSFNKAAMRMFGTLIAAVVALVIIALAPQERWLFMLLLSSWVGFCTYMMGGPNFQYFWNVCGFVAVIICLGTDANSVNTFSIAILRAQETGLGILVYSLVALFLWPVSSGADFKAASCKLATTWHELFKANLKLMGGKGNAGEEQALRARVVQEQTRFGQLLDAAETDTYEVGELREQWRHFQRQSAELTETMARWRESFTEVQSLDLDRLLPNLKVFGAELDARLVQIGSMLGNQAPERQPSAVDLVLDKEGVRALSHFHRAALAVCRSRLQHMEQLTRSLFDIVNDIKGRSRRAAAAITAPPISTRFVLDPDRVAGLVQILATMWLAYLVWIYVDSIPGGAGIVTMTTVLGMAMAAMPQLPVSAFFKPVGTGVFFAAVLYIFIMPGLSSFLGLGLLIFAATFVICYLYADPRQALGRAFGLALFLAIASVSNQQTYSFLVVANTALQFSLVLLVLAVTAYIPFYPRPDRAFLRLLGRFFRSSEHLISTINWDPGRPPTLIDRWRRDIHARDVATIPRKLGVWSRFIDTKALSGTSPDQVQLLVNSLQGLTYRVQELLAERGTPQSQYLVRELLTDFQAWRLRMEETFQRLSKDPAAGERETFRSKLDEIMDRLEERIKSALDKASKGLLSDRDGENFYRLLGAYRGVSEAIVDYVGNASVIDWSQWREEKF